MSNQNNGMKKEQLKYNKNSMKNNKYKITQVIIKPYLNSADINKVAISILLNIKLKKSLIHTTCNVIKSSVF